MGAEDQFDCGTIPPFGVSLHGKRTRRQAKNRHKDRHNRLPNLS